MTQAEKIKPIKMNVWCEKIKNNSDFS